MRGGCGGSYGRTDKGIKYGSMSCSEFHVSLTLSYRSSRETIVQWREFMHILFFAGESFSQRLFNLIWADYFERRDFGNVEVCTSGSILFSSWKSFSSPLDDFDLEIMKLIDIPTLLTRNTTAESRIDSPEDDSIFALNGSKMTSPKRPNYPNPPPILHPHYKLTFTGFRPIHTPRSSSARPETAPSTSLLLGRETDLRRKDRTLDEHVAAIGFSLHPASQSPIARRNLVLKSHFFLRSLFRGIFRVSFD